MLSRTSGWSSAAQSGAQGVLLLLSLGMSPEARHTWQISTISGCKDDKAVASCQHQGVLLISWQLLDYIKSKLWAQMWLDAMFVSVFTYFSPFHLVLTLHNQPSSSLLLGAVTLISTFHEPHLDVSCFVWVVLVQLLWNWNKISRTDKQTDACVLPLCMFACDCQGRGVAWVRRKSAPASLQPPPKILLA